MRSLAVLEIVALALVAFAAGFVDSIAGGGGLVQVPGLFVAFPDRPPADIFGTNKGSSIAGTAVATYGYVRAGAMPWNTAVPAALASLPASAIGASLVHSLDPSVVRPIVLVLLVAVLGFTVARPEIGVAGSTLDPSTRAGRAALIGLALGFYDGFFGPGTGTFLVFAFVRMLGLDFLASTAAAKLVNLATNLAAVVTFAIHGHVLWSIAIPMAFANIAGALVGTKIAIERGSPLVRRVFVVVSLGLLLRISWDLVQTKMRVVGSG